MRFGVEALSPIETVGVGIWTLEAEVNNGGFDRYYLNSAGDLALATVTALKSIGAARAARILEAANAAFPDSLPPGDRVKRQDALDEHVDRSHFEALDAEFYTYPDDLLSLLASYLRRHSVSNLPERD
jgi:hypothetical protein